MKNSNYKPARLFATAFALLLVATFAAHASGDRILGPGKDMPILIGPCAGVNYHHVISAFTIPSASDFCSSFDGNNNTGFELGAKAFIPVGSNFSFSPRMQYEDLGNDLTDNGLAEPFFGLNNQIEYASTTDANDFRPKLLNFDLLATYQFTDFGLYAALGPSFGILVSSKDYAVTSHLNAPDGVTFLNGSRDKVIYRGTADVNPLIFSIRGGLGWNWQISDMIYINPEALFGFSTNSILKNNSEQPWAFNFTLGVLFAL